MRSSNVGRRASSSLLVVFALTTGCTNAPVREQAGPAASVDCPSDGITDPQDVKSLAEMHSATETGPVYQALASGGRLRSCRGTTRSGELSLQYLFVDGDTLTVARNPTLEYSNVEVQFGSPSQDDAIGLLRRAERSLFSPDGCGIDWSDATPLDPKNGVSETAYYGDLCNCQARVRRNAEAEVVGLAFRSAC
jgi:hypothetical protein